MEQTPRPDDRFDEIRRAYRRFAAVEAAPRSPVYAELAEHVSRDDVALHLIRRLPPAKRQPNLLLGAVQYLRGPLTGVDALDAALAEQGDEIVDVVLHRTTQTNVPARCTTLVPALAQLPQPLALVEVGASAGLCLYPDRYAYDYGGTHLPARDVADAVTFPCAVDGGVPVPDEPVEVVWRAGLDLNPLDVTDPDDRAWLTALVWPGQEERHDHLRAAAALVAADPPLLVAGDLVDDLPPLLAQAPQDATLVVFHSAVLPYVDPVVRQRFVDTVRGSRAVWLANESPARIPGVDATGHPDGQFLLCRDGRPLARADPHGTWLTWLA